MLYFIAKGLTIVFVGSVIGLSLAFLKEIILGLLSGKTPNYTYSSSVNYSDPSYKSDLMSWGSQRYS
jgi:hypothetical protein